MAEPVRFGWRVPDFPERYPNQPTMRATQFRRQILTYMDTIHGGLDSIWVGDHFFPWPGEVDQSLDTIESWTTLSYLAGRYPDMTFGTIVLSQGYRNPALLAKMSANLQWLTGGRHVLGIGAGWKENEYLAYGYPFPPDRVRLKQLGEAVQVILAMWTEDCPTYEGEYYTIRDACLAPRPNPLPPLLIGGMGPKVTLKMVAQFADWCNINNTNLEFTRERLEILRQHCQTVDRPYEQIIKTFSSDCVVVAETHEEAERMKADSYFSRFDDGALVGTPDEVADQIQRYVDLDISHFILRFVDFPNTEGVRLFMDEVAPRFREK